MYAQAYPVRLLCELLECAPSSYSYQSRERAEDSTLRDEIERIALAFSRYGYRRITAERRRR